MIFLLYLSPILAHWRLQVNARAQALKRTTGGASAIWILDSPTVLLASQVVLVHMHANSLSQQPLPDLFNWLVASGLVVMTAGCAALTRRPHPYLSCAALAWVCLAAFSVEVAVAAGMVGLIGAQSYENRLLQVMPRTVGYSRYAQATRHGPRLRETCGILDGMLLASLPALVSPETPLALTDNYAVGAQVLLGAGTLLVFLSAFGALGIAPIALPGLSQVQSRLVKATVRRGV